MTLGDRAPETDRIVTRDLYENAAPAALRSPGTIAAAASLVIGIALDWMGLGVVGSTCAAVVLFPVLLVMAKKRAVDDATATTVGFAEERLRQFLAAPPVMMDLAPIAAIGRKGVVVTGAVYDGSWFYIVENGVAARIPLRMIRSWSWKVEGHESHRIYAAGGFQHMGAAALMQIQANRDNVAREVGAWRASGLFVQVADVQHPTWQFVSRDKAVLERWHELLTQLREGRLEAR